MASGRVLSLTLVSFLPLQEPNTWRSSYLLTVCLDWFMGNNNGMLTCHGLSGI